MSTGRLALMLAGAGILMVTWLAAALEYSSLPPVIPIHFNFRCEADNFGPRWNIFIPALISTVLGISLFWLSRFPHIYNYPVKITESNRERQYHLASMLVLRIKALIALMFLFVTLSIAGSSKGNDYLPAWLIFFPLAALFMMIFYYLWEAGNKR